MKSGKSLSDVEVSQSTLNGIKQGILNIVVQKVVTFGISKFSAWRGKYTAKQVEDALEDLQVNPEKYGVKNAITEQAQNVVNRITNKLKSRGLSDKIIDDIMLRAMYIDDAIGANKMTSMLDEIADSYKFKNPEDLVSNLKSVFSDDIVNSTSAKNLLKEFEEGKYWMNQGNEVYISKKWALNGDEVDVTVITKGALVECKNITGGSSAIRDRLEDIIKKFTDESKLSLTIKKQYPNHYGKISISNSSNEFYNLNKQQFIIKIREDLFPNIENSGINKSKLIDAVKELHIENGQGRFVIKNTEW